MSRRTSSFRSSTRSFRVTWARETPSAAAVLGRWRAAARRRCVARSLPSSSASSTTRRTSPCSSPACGRASRAALLSRWRKTSVVNMTKFTLRPHANAEHRAGAHSGAPLKEEKSKTGEKRSNRDAARPFQHLFTQDPLWTKRGPENPAMQQAPRRILRALSM